MAFEPVLPLHKVVPSWTLPVVGVDETFSLNKPRGRAHTVLVVAKLSIDIVPYLRELAPQINELQALPARGVVVFTSHATASVTEPALSSADIPDVPAPWKAALDLKAHVRRTYLPADAHFGVFILDRYNDLYHQWLGSQEADLPSPRDVIEWIESVGRQCSI